MTTNYHPARFCLLEQLLPEGMEHPFAKTMMAHFDKLQTPLQSVQKYPTTRHQEERFINSGWSTVSARNLWDLWSSPEFLSSSERMALDHVESFDEWEEFAVFGYHYFLLVAKNNKETKPSSSFTPAKSSEERERVAEPISAKAVYSESHKLNGCRRFAGCLPLRGLNTHTDVIGNFGGLGPSTRVNSYDVFSLPPTTRTLSPPTRTAE